MHIIHDEILTGLYILLQIGISAITSLIAVIIMYQNCKWTCGQEVPPWILTLTRLQYKKPVLRFKNVRNTGSIVTQESVRFI